jgi:peptidoglycan hydrolase-like protein with peptidoglycan-binding domain
MSARRHHRLLAVALAAAAVALPAAVPAAGAASLRPPSTAEAGVLGPGARGPVVRALQRELRRRGLPVRADGRYGPRTRRAVVLLQRRLGLRVNGIVDRPFLWALGLSVCGLPGPTSARGGPRGELRLGAYGPRVCALQRALRRAGERGLEVDGGYGPATRAAVRRAQRRLGLRPTGVGTTGLVRRLAGAGPAPGGVGPGSTGPAVRGLQSELRARGYDLVADGAYGPRTRRAVAQVERRLGLPVDGRADPALLRRLRAAPRGVLQAFPVPGPHAYSDDWGAPRPQGRHRGTDIVAARGEAVVAVRDGTIERLSRADTGLGGIRLWLRGDDGTAFYYAHLRSIAPDLRPGSRVRAGRRIGAVGRTGDARGGIFHLHFEIHPRGRGAVNPYPELRVVERAARAT